LAERTSLQNELQGFIKDSTRPDGTALVSWSWGRCLRDIHSFTSETNINQSRETLKTGKHLPKDQNMLQLFKLMLSRGVKASVNYNHYQGKSLCKQNARARVVEN